MIVSRKYRRHIKRILSPVPKCYGSGFKRWRQLLEESQWWDEQKLQEYQDQELRGLMRHCYEHVPYYRDVFNARGLKPADFQTAADLVKLPLLTKDDIRA